SYTAANSSLKSEKSKQFALGVVWDPLDWLGAKVDYANLKIDDKLTLIGAQDLVDRTNGTSQLPIPAGLYVQRDSTGSITRIQQGFANEGTLKAQFLDVSLVSRWKLANFGRFEHELRWSRVLKYNEAGVDTLGDLGLPKNRAQLNNNWKLGPVAAQWNVNYIGRNGKDEGLIAASYVTHDIQVKYTTPFKGSLIVGMMNAFDKQPQLVAYDGRNFNFYLYDSYGRQPYVKYEQSF
ncbi:MAG: TonB-dependent receptor, partial [Proteobacteria bacterium]